MAKKWNWCKSLLSAVKHCIPKLALKSWFCDFLTSCMLQLKIPRIWRRALIVAIPKPEKPLGDPKNYCLISLLCVPFTSLERLIYSHVKPITDQLLPLEQAVFQHGRSTIDQVTLLTKDIEDSFSAKKAGAVFVYLTAACDTVWHGSLICKLCYLAGTWSTWSYKRPWQCILTLTTGKQSRLRCLNNVPQAFVPAPFLFNIRIPDLPTTVCRKYAPDDREIMHADGDRQAMEGVLSKDMATVVNTCRLGS